MLLGGALLLAGMLFVWAGRTLIDTGGFVEATSDALDEQPVQRRLGELVAAKMVELQPDLAGGEPLIAAAAEGILASNSLQGVLLDATRVLHGGLLSQPDRPAVLQLHGIVTRLRAVIEPLDPRIAAQLPDAETVEIQIAKAGDARAKLLSAVKSIRYLSYVLPSLAAIAFAAAVFMRPDRPAALIESSVVVILAAVVPLITVIRPILGIVGAELPSSVDSDAVSALWRAYAGPMRDVRIVVLLFGMAMLVAALLMHLPAKPASGELTSNNPADDPECKLI